MRVYRAVEDFALFRVLESRPDLHAKVLELRTKVHTYLGAVSATFAQYTSHAIDHSDQIVRELSAFLFTDQFSPESAVTSLNATEAYLLLLSAYLHDTGMVVTNQEKIDALGSEAWAEFSSTHRATADIVAISSENVGTEQSAFISGLEQQWALAEFFRRQHAERAAAAINGALHIGAYLDDDPAAERTLIAICVGHGLSPRALASEVEYPTRRDLYGEPVDVRLLAVLLRIGDLLDMRYERACPLLRSTVSPLPRSSEVHWSQYARIVHRSTSPDKVELRAECTTADEHRLLLDWCAWLAQEIEGAGRLLRGEPRHASWTVPQASVDPSGTIEIVRASGATYRVEDWKFYFDEAAVVSRLVRDIHGRGLGWLRELIQNALDATRVRMYLDESLTESYPNQVPQGIRANYPLVLNIKTGAEGDSVESVEISDVGIGMTTETIKNYFLQIGRSWYSSRSFVGQFPFTPTSRFGVGFLSVFGASDDVVVTTRWHEDQPSGAISMRFSGPRGYLLIEDSSRPDPGTTVIVRLRDRLHPEALIRYLASTCRAVEFPLEVRVDGELQDITSDIDSPAPVDLPVDSSTRCRYRRIDVTGGGGFGYLEFLVLEREGVEDWSLSSAALENAIVRLAPLASVPVLGESIVAVNGLASEAYYPRAAGDALRLVLDLRTTEAVAAGGLDRNSPRSAPPSAVSLIQAALRGHLDGRGEDLGYVARLVSKFADMCPEWAANTPYIETAGSAPTSLANLMSCEVIYLPLEPLLTLARTSDEEADATIVEFAQHAGASDRTVAWTALRRMSTSHRESLMRGAWRRVIELSPTVTVVEVSPSSTQAPAGIWTPAFAANSDIVVVRVGYRNSVVNNSHPLVQAIEALQLEHKVASDRLFSAFLNWRGTDAAFVGQLRGVAAAVQSAELETWADAVAGTRRSFSSRYDMLRVARTPRGSGRRI